MLWKKDFLAAHLFCMQNNKRSFQFWIFFLKKCLRKSNLSASLKTKYASEPPGTSFKGWRVLTKPHATQAFHHAYVWGWFLLHSSTDAAVQWMMTHAPCLTLTLFVQHLRPPASFPVSALQTPKIADSKYSRGFMIDQRQSDVSCFLAQQRDWEIYCQINVDNKNRPENTNPF